MIRSPRLALTNRSRCARLLTTCGPTDEQRDGVLTSDAYGTFAAELRRAEANGQDVERILPVAAARHSVDTRMVWPPCCGTASGSPLQVRDQDRSDAGRR